MIQGRGNIGLVCEFKEVVGGMDERSVGLYMKGRLTDKSVTVSRN